MKALHALLTSVATLSATAALPARATDPALAAGRADVRPDVRPDIRPGERLSTWLLAQPADESLDRSALLWLVDDEIPRQAALQLQLRQDLQRAATASMPTAAAARELLDWVMTRPVTGRVPVNATDPRWLEVNPLHDPVLKPGQRVSLPPRSTTVTVLTDAGERCVVRHRAGLESGAYVQACAVAKAGLAMSREAGHENARDVDWVWVAQPDGRVQKHGLALWNATTQDEPAPGAWIWAPARASAWNERLSERLITFLATQGPARDAEAARVIQPEAATALPARLRSREVSSSDWGGTGLMQTPSARMHDSGYFAFGAARIKPYTHGNVTLQPLGWLEVAFRYTDISNVLYGPSIAGTQSYKDKSIDLKLRALEETATLPEVAVGLHDLTGTGLFSGEYVVASKRTGPIDWSAGLGWGYMAGRANWANPLSLLGGRFDQRMIDIGQGGKFNPSAYFHGRTAFFAGLEYQSPWAPLRLKLEYDSNNYQHEPFGNAYVQRSPFNAGLVYRAGSVVDFSVGIERGNTLMLGFTLQTQADQLSMPKLSDPPRLTVVPNPAAATPTATGTAAAATPMAATRAELIAQTQWQATRIERVGRELQVTFADAEATDLRERVDRAVSVLHRDAPADIDRFALIYRERGVVMARHVINRDAWVREQTEPLPPRAQTQTVRAEPAPEHASGAGPRRANLGPEVFEAAPRRFEAGLGMGLQENLGGPDAFLLYQVSAVERWKLRLREDLWLQGSLNLGLIDNYSRFKYDAPSDLPRVRTYIREYLTSSRLTMPTLQLTQVGELAPDHYYSLYGGYLESMFGGVGGEWLYRPFASRLAFGVDANLVEQRNFRQDLRFGQSGDQSGYRVATGHATLYWDTGWNGLRTQVSAGRYLAGDVGGTVLVAREFGNGVQMGAYATKTNVSAAQFGEGSFDKGIFLKIPFDAFSTRSSASQGSFNYHPLTRDGGARLERAVTLMEVTRLRDDRALRVRDPVASPVQAGRTEPERADPARAWAVDRWLRTQDPREAFTKMPARPMPAGVATGVAAGVAAGVAGLRAAIEPDTARGTAPHARVGNTDGVFDSDALEAALTDQGFRNLRVAFDASRTLRIAATRDLAESASAAVGRIARTALRFAPLDTRSLAIDHARRGAPAVSYAFADARLLERCLEGLSPVSALAPTTGIVWHDPSLREADALSRLIDVDAPLAASLDRPNAAQALLPEPTQIARIVDDLVVAGRTARNIDWTEASVLLGSSVLSAALLDARADRFAAQHGGSTWAKAGIRLGNALPWAGLAGAGLLALDPSDTTRARTATRAVEAGGTGLALSIALKLAVGRERPGDTPGIGGRAFSPFARTGSNDSFPSNHTITAWAVAAPFALEYNAPWLYGVAAISNAARVGSRAHWLSDTVAGSALGYGVGRIFWQSDREPRTGATGLVPQISVSPNSVAAAWPW